MITIANIATLMKFATFKLIDSNRFANPVNKDKTQLKIDLTYRHGGNIEHIFFLMGDRGIYSIFATHASALPYLSIQRMQRHLWAISI